MFSSLRLARSRSSTTTSCAGGGEKEPVNGEVHEQRHVYQVTPQGAQHGAQGAQGSTPQGQAEAQHPKQQQRSNNNKNSAPLPPPPPPPPRGGLSSCPTSPLLSGKPPKTPRSLARRGSSKWGLDKALCPSIASLRERVASGGPSSRYDPDDADDSSDVCTCSKVTRVAVKREDGCLGITVRGGAPSALVITSVHPGGPADKEGSIRPGDRLLAVDGVNLQLADLSTAHAALRGQGRVGHHAAGHPDAVAVLTIEYSVCVVGAVVGAQGPLLVELARPPAHQLGLTLVNVSAWPGRGTVIVDDIKPASVADRSGALHRGDQILAVDDVRVEGTDLTAADVAVLLAGQHASLRLQVVPAHCVPPGLVGSPLGSPRQYAVRGGSSSVHQRSPCPSESSLSAYNMMRSLRGYDNGSLASSAGGGPATCSTALSASYTSGLVSHSEMLSVLLRPEPVCGYGLAVRASGPSRIPTISALHPDGPAERSGCLQVGDRIVAVDDREVDAEQLALLLDNPGPPIALRVSFSVAESVVPASGVFTVKLAKCRPGLGITITGNKTGEYLYISDIKCGSVAHRSGTLSVGDRLLEVDGLGLGGDLGRALDDAARALHASGDVVTLKVLKDDTPSEMGSNWSGWGGLGGDWVNSWPRSIEYPLEYAMDYDFPVEYTVELVRHGGPLGLTIAGSEDPTDSVTISGLTPGGLAEQTGALHVGDRLLAINGECLRGRRLSEAIALFQNSPDVVTLKIARTGSQRARSHKDEALGMAIPSVDSAVESWDSNTSPSGTPLATAAASGGGRVKLTPLPPGLGVARSAAPAAPTAKVAATGPAATPTSTPTATNQPLSRRAGSCPSLDCILQNGGVSEAVNNHAEWDGSLEDLESAAATAAANLAVRTIRSSGKDSGGVVSEVEGHSSPIPPPASFRQGLQAGGGSRIGALWPRPPPSPSPTSSVLPLPGRLSAAKALNNDWQQRQRQHKQQDEECLRGDNDDVGNMLTNKLSSFQWPSNNGTHHCRDADSASNNTSLRIYDDFSELSNNLQRRQDSQHFVFDEHRASSVLLEEVGDDVIHDLGLQHPLDLYQVTIFKDSVYEDFGFSVSDGLYERGVFINRIRKGGPADAAGVLRPYDRILQVNETRTQDFDCCLTVPLIAAAGDRIQLIVARQQFSDQGTVFTHPSNNSFQSSSTVTQTI